MKIRNGFVSNSSSSSFIIECTGKTKTVRDVATIMVNQLIENIKIEKWGNWREHIKYKKTWLKNLQTVDENHPIEFPSCNYDTWIMKVGDKILISTCNNESWKLPNTTSQLSEETKQELKKLMKESDYGNFTYELYDFSIQYYFKDFYSLNFDIVGREAIMDWNDINYDYHNSYCKKIHNGKECGTHLWETRLGIKCPICDKGLFERKKKLEQLNNLK